MNLDRQTLWLLGGIGGLLVLSSAITAVLKLRAGGTPSPVIANLAARVNAWWVMVLLFSVALLTGGAGSVILFALVSFFALREFATLTPTRPGDHRTLFWAFFVVIPIQYYLVWSQWYGFFAVFIPVFAYVLLPIRSAAAGDCENFLERTAVTQWGLMICVYFVSH